MKKILVLLLSGAIFLCACSPKEIIHLLQVLQNHQSNRKLLRILLSKMKKYMQVLWIV